MRPSQSGTIRTLSLALELQTKVRKHGEGPNEGLLLVESGY